MTPAVDKPCLGGKEKVAFPELSRRKETARIDTGAKTSSIHYEKLWIEQTGDKKVLCVHLLRASAPVTRFRRFRVKTVKSSNGMEETRYAVKLRLRLGEQEYLTEFTLARRDRMSYPVLLGRKFLRHRFVVDVSSDYLYTAAK